MDIIQLSNPEIWILPSYNSNNKLNIKSIIKYIMENCYIVVKAVSLSNTVKSNIAQKLKEMDFVQRNKA